MFRVLVVEDDASKRMRVAEALSAISGFDVGWIFQEADAVSARRRLNEYHFDLMILDIAIPNRMNEDARDSGGWALLDEIMSRADYQAPIHVLGITAYDHLLRGDRTDGRAPVMKLIHYDPTSDQWRSELQEAVCYLMGAKWRANGCRGDYDIYLGIVCAMERPELEAVLDLDWGWQERRFRGDDTSYFVGTLVTAHGPETVVAAAATRKGMPAAGVLAAKMIYTLRPRYLCMPGITAGVRGRSSFGDVIVADVCWDWGSGKWVGSGSEVALLPSPYQSGPSADVLSGFRRLSRDVGLLASIRQGWKGVKPDNELIVRIGPVASGAAVVADAGFRRRIEEQHRELLGIEMESYGVFVAAQEVSTPRPAAVALKAVVDYADDLKDDRFQSYGAYTSAKVLEAWGSRYLE